MNTTQAHVPETLLCLRHCGQSLVVTLLEFAAWLIFSTHLTCIISLPFDHISITESPSRILVLKPGYTLEYVGDFRTCRLLPLPHKESNFIGPAWDFPHPTPTSVGGFRTLQMSMQPGLEASVGLQGPLITYQGESAPNKQVYFQFWKGWRQQWSSGWCRSCLEWWWLC